MRGQTEEWKTIQARVALHSPQYDRVLAKLCLAKEVARKRYIETGDRSRLDCINNRERRVTEAFYSRVKPE